ncbi:separase [Tanacetum coccineum]|uniref:Separase n=1 Tax=Tanacetum coccineum TaxID=301880 RepID=A0ABQ4XDA9_9ASTR
MLVTHLIKEDICTSLFSPPNACSIHLLTRVLDVIAFLSTLAKCSTDRKNVLGFLRQDTRDILVVNSHRKETTGNYLEFVDYCANQCRNATIDLCDAVATHFNILANVFSEVKGSAIELIIRLYAISLADSDLNSYSRNGFPKMEKFAEDKLLYEGYMSSYFTALKFLCKPISKLLISELEDTLFRRELPNIEDAFHQFILVSSASNKDGDVCNSSTACTLFICDLVSTRCLQTKGLQYLHASLQNVGIVLRKSGLREEHQAYMEFNFLILEMQLKISNPLKEICNTKDPILLKSRLLIANARDSRAHGIEGMNDSIKYLSKAILIMSDLHDKDEYARDLLAQAYCLRTLCTQEAEPNSKLFVEDIGDALKQWLSQKHPQSAEQTLTLLYHIGDLLLLKYFTWKDVPLKECITILWQSRSLRHCLCTSPVSDAFIMTLSKHCDLSKSMEFWISCMERSKSLGIGFMQNLSVISTLSSPNSCKHEHATQPDVKQAASDLISKVPASSKSLFLAAHLYYDLCERVIAKGSMIEALSYAKEAHHLRAKLLKQRFMYSTEQHNDIFGDNGELIQKCGYELKSFHMDPSVATLAWSSHYMDSSDLVDFILTPWNVLQCYLESTLQVGTIQEIIGNGSDAEKNFRWGKNVSLFHGLPIFLVSFSSALGQLYRKQRLWRSAHKELKSANDTLDDDSYSLISCSKLQQELSKAETLYRSAVDKLELTEWKNCVSVPNKTTSSKKMFCDSLMIGGIDVNMASAFGNKIEQEEIQPKVTKKGKKTAEPLPQGIKMSKPGCITSGGSICDDKDCWHCLSYEVMKSLSVESIIQMQWEITRRRLLLRLLTGIDEDLRPPFDSNNVSSLLLCNFSRNDCCGLSFIPMPTVLSGLKLAFILFREVPKLFQKVSRLLSVLYTLSSNQKLCVPLPSEALCESQWASFFQKVSIGADFNHQLFSHPGKPADNTTHVDGSSVTNSTPLSLHRLAPESVMDLEKFIINFFANLPHATIVCISVLGDTYARFLRKLMPHEYPARAWIMFSRLNSDHAPIVIALPLGSVLAGSLEDDQDLSSCILPSSVKSWHCPWDHTVIDEVAQLFRSILEKSYASISEVHLWILKRTGHYGGREGENLMSILGYGRFMVWSLEIPAMGGALNCEHLDSVTKKLMKDLKSMSEVDISESILRSVISCASSQQKECLSELILKKGCYIGDRSPKESSLMLSDVTNAIHEIGDEAREPVILVPDFDIQMLPWESMPLLKNQEVYRMPSVASISCTYNRCCRVQEKVGKKFAVFPMIDPLDAYYLLNPGGDLSETQARFEAWFIEHNLEVSVSTL